MPKGLRFLPKLSLIKCAFEALCVNDLKGLTFDAEREGDAATGEQARLRGCRVLCVCVCQLMGGWNTGGVVRGGDVVRCGV